MIPSFGSVDDDGMCKFLIRRVARYAFNRDAAAGEVTYVVGTLFEVIYNIYHNPTTLTNTFDSVFIF